MSPVGRRASLPPADHARPETLAPDGLVVHHYNQDGRVRDYDFAELPVPEPMQHSLAALFAARCAPHRWTVHTSSAQYWFRLMRFAQFVSQQEHPPRDLDELTPTLIARWRNWLRPGDGYAAFTVVASLLRSDARLQTGRVADELARRVTKPKSTVQSYSQAEFDQIKTAARRTFRAAALRIEDNARQLDRWRHGLLTEGSRDWVIGEGLDHLARTGDLPKYTNKNGTKTAEPIKKYRKQFGGTRAELTWQRLFLSRMEAAALGVLLLAEYGWNLSVINQLEVPRAAPDPGEDGRPTYRIPLEKPRRGAGRHHETRNVTDDGAASPGRLITQALQATRFARALVEEFAPGTDRLIIWRTNRLGRQRAPWNRLPPVGPFHFGIQSHDATRWAQAAGFPGSPFRRGRRTVIALDRREPGQHSQDTHDRHYVLVDKRVQAEAVEVIAAGAEDAAERARTTVLVAHLSDTPNAADKQTATADCTDYDNSPWPAPGGGCGASFLMCLACINARIHPGHHGRLAHLHQALGNLHSVMPPTTWQADWGDAHARLDDLKTTLGNGVWAQALSRVTDADRADIDLLLTGALDT